MLSHITIQSLGQVRLEEMHEQARRAALAKTARRARRAQRTRAALGERLATWTLGHYFQPVHQDE